MMATPATSARPARGKRSLATTLVQLGCLAALLLLWHVLTTTGRISPLFLPAPADVAVSFWSIVASGEANKDIQRHLVRAGDGRPDRDRARHSQPAS